MLSSFFKGKDRKKISKKLENVNGRPKINLDTDKISEMKLDGMTNAAIAKKLGVSNVTIKNRLSEIGILGTKAVGKPRLDISNNLISEMKKKEMTNVAIAKKLSCSEGTIRNRLKEMKQAQDNS